MISTDTTKSTSALPIVFRGATRHDGAALWRLVQDTGTLELNSPYFYVLFATDFAGTCLVAEHNGSAIGAVIGYQPPNEPNAAFVWQIGLLPHYQGQGLGLQLLQHWLDLPANRHCQWVTATVADDNQASQALFRRMARDLECPCDERPHFTADMFPGDHAPENLFRVGPILRRGAASLPMSG